MKTKYFSSYLKCYLFWGKFQTFKDAGCRNVRLLWNLLEVGGAQPVVHEAIHGREACAHDSAGLITLSWAEL